MLEAELFDNAYGAFEAMFDERQRCEAIVERLKGTLAVRSADEAAKARIEEALNEIRTGSPV